MRIVIEKIMIMERIRKEISKIDELAQDMKQNGLLHAVTVMPLEGGEFRLLAGLRRIKAAQSLGWTEIEAKAVSPADAEAALRIEISENEQREPFTFSEKMNYARLIEEIEQAKAIERKSAGGKGGLVVDVGRGPRLDQGKSRDIIGEKIGMSGRQYCRAKYVVENAPPEVIEQLDKGERTICGAYDELRAGEKAGDPEKLKVPNESANAKPEHTPKRQENAKPKKRTEKPMSLPKQTPTTTYRIPKQRPLSAQDVEAARKLSEYHALSPEGKIEDLKRQLREERARAADAESELAYLKDLYHNAVSHKDSIIDSLKWQLDAANARITELEDKYEPGQHTQNSNLCLVVGGAL